jgi:MOSC domain-containing protein YiiM
MSEGGAGELAFAHDVDIVRLVASPVHRYAGRPGEGGVPAAALDAHDVVFVRAGLGIVGDRFFGQPAHRRASITVMSAEALDALAAAIGGGPYDPALARRNVVVRGIDADRLAGQRFSIDSGDGPVELQGHRPARPCAWLDAAFGPGAQRALRGRGGVRCEPLRSGSLRLGPAVLRASW